jgi:ERCC4-related helicase
MLSTQSKLSRAMMLEQNLRVTSQRVEELVDEAREKGRKLICFVTGVPGAGKTLVGLNIATRRREPEQPTHAVFLSGNGPLVAVLREALTRDEVVRRRNEGEKVRKGKVAESVKAFIQNVHHFRDDALIDSGPPIEHVVIFDEAQRAWNIGCNHSHIQPKACFSASIVSLL